MRPIPEPDVSRVAGMIGEPARAAMLSALLGGQALPAGELARLAGVLGVLVTDRLLERRLLRGGAGFQLTDAGDRWLHTLGVDVDALRRSRRTLARPCLDWSERRDHLAGAAGAAIASAMLERRRLVRVDGTRAVRLTLRGREGLCRSLGLEIHEGSRS